MCHGMSQVVKAQIAPHPRHVASDGAICITPHQHFLAIAHQQSWCTDVGIIHRVRAVLRAVFPSPANQDMGQREGAGEVESDEMPRSGHADFLAWHQASLILRTLPLRGRQGACGGSICSRAICWNSSASLACPSSLSLLFLPLVGEQLAGARQQLPLPLAHLDRVAPRGALHPAFRWRGQQRFLDRLAATDRLHGDPGLELGTVGAALAQFLRRRLRLRWEPPFRGGAPPQRLTMGAVQKSQTT